ncbi:protein lin-54 homolog isoform X2 [Hydra vulgaris]|uniref:Protein lin-54 homolog isoform X2 n=1 Tax=Hydra vulgaris TaxID=6087 RepID=A0ABM4D8A1_HYDVU
MQKPSSKIPEKNVTGTFTYVKVQPTLKEKNIKLENKKVSNCVSIFEPLVGPSNQFIPVHDAQNSSQYVQLQLSSDQNLPAIQLRNVQSLQSSHSFNFIDSTCKEHIVSHGTKQTLNNQVIQTLTISSPMKITNSKNYILSTTHSSASQSSVFQSSLNGVSKDVSKSISLMPKPSNDRTIAPATSFQIPAPTTSLNSNLVITSTNHNQSGHALQNRSNQKKLKNQAVNHVNSFPSVAIKSSKVAMQQPMFVPITMAGTISMYTNQDQQNGTLRIHHQIAPRLSTSKSSIVTINPSNHSFLIPVQSQSEKSGMPQLFIQNLSQCQSNSTEPIKDGFSNDNLLRIDSNKSASKANVGPITESKILKKPCNCTKSQCLKLYCECFANGEFCNNCNCRICFNNIAHEVERSKAIKSCLDRNPYAFHPKIGKGKIKGDTERRHTKGCNCRRSGCLKNYCECYEAKILCSTLCKCSGCKNFEESADRKTLMQLADAAEVRVLQQNAAISKLDTEMKVLNGETQCFKDKISFITEDVSKLTCDILLARAQEAEFLNEDEVQIEHSVLEEFSRCLNQIIDKTNGFKKRKK